MNTNKDFGYIKKVICNLLESLLVRNNHKAQFRRYISTGYIDKNKAVELYDNVLINLQRWINIRIGGILLIGLFFYFENVIIFLVGAMLLSYLLHIFTYDPCRIIINYIFPKAYHNGSNKNLWGKTWLESKGNQIEIERYAPQKPIKMNNIGSYSPWKCPKCKKRNLIANRICSKCNFEHYWECADCSTLNISDNLSCIKCNREKNYSEYIREKWTCKGCQEEHENQFDTCWKCSSKKTKKD